LSVVARDAIRSASTCADYVRIDVLAGARSDGCGDVLRARESKAKAKLAAALVGHAAGPAGDGALALRARIAMTREG